MNKNKKLIICLILLTFLLLILISIQTKAFELYKTSKGKNIHWINSKIEIILDYSMENLGGTRKEVEQELNNAFNLWVEDASLPLYLEITWDICDELILDNRNCIFACYDKNICYKRSKEKGGTTYLHAYASTGYIIGADIVLNADDWEWNINESNPNGVCLERVLSHEIGHILGIYHSKEPDAIMYPKITKNTKAATSLHWDDKKAAKTLYKNFIELDEYTPICSSSTISKLNNNLLMLILILFF